MADQYIKTFEGRIVGIIETQANGDQLARDFDSRQILGFYRSQYDDTTDFYGRVLAKGNILASLIWQNKK